MTIAADRNLAAHVPAGWSVVALKEVLLTSQYGLNSPSGNGGAVPIVGMKDIQGGRVDVTSLASIDIDGKILEAYRLRPGDILLNRTNSPDLVGKIGIFTGDVLAVFASYLVRLQANSKIIIPHFLNAWLNAAPVQHIINRVATRAISQANINPTRFLDECFVPIPPLPEQRRIAAILGTWDAAIEKTERLVDAAQRQFEALRTELYREDGSEERMTFDDFLDESRIPGNDGSTARKLTVRLYGKGIEPKQDRTAGSANTRYYVRKSGQFIYSRLDFLNGAFAVVPDHLDGFQSTLDLPAFDIAPHVNPIWLLNYVTRPAYYENQQNLARGQRVARRVNPDDLLASEIAVPTRERQDEIAAILTLCIDEIRNTRSVVAALRRQKSGLMQKLLTGKIRVPEAVADLSPAAD